MVVGMGTLVWPCGDDLHWPQATRGVWRLGLGFPWRLDSASLISCPLGHAKGREAATRKCCTTRVARLGGGTKVRGVERGIATALLVDGELRSESVAGSALAAKVDDLWKGRTPVAPARVVVKGIPVADHPDHRTAGGEAAVGRGCPGAYHRRTAVLAATARPPARVGPQLRRRKADPRGPQLLGAPCGDREARALVGGITTRLGGGRGSQHHGRGLRRGCALIMDGAARTR